MKTILSEKNIVVILFVMVLVTFSLAQEDLKKAENMHSTTASASKPQLIVKESITKAPGFNSNSVPR